MEKIPSFTIDHNLLSRGVYVSRQDHVGKEVITTFDIRMKEPNREPVIDVPTLHAMEHLAATYLRNNSEWKERVIYFGPMGCRTGNYLILAGDLKSEEIIPLLKELYSFMAEYQEEIPGSSAKDCGNYLSMDLPMTRWESKKFLTEVLECIKEENLIYPQA